VTDRAKGGMPRVLIAVSVTEERAGQLREGGPRRDFDALADRVDGTLVYQRQQARRGVLARFMGPHIRQAWHLARRARPRDVIFADGEHVGLPLLLFLQLWFRRPARVVMLGHLPGRRWKLAGFGLLTRLGIPGAVLVHSVEQARLLRPWVGRRWTVETIPYQVDTAFWTREDTTPLTSERAGADAWPMLFAVGSEHRDYSTLAQAVTGLPVSVKIAAGSHWARSLAGLEEQPPNVEYLDQVLDFSALREEYRRAAMVVVPLHDVPNQSGVTTILEAMSLQLPVIVTATRGQRECIVGPLVRLDGTLDEGATRDRGPHLFLSPDARPRESSATTGLYAAPGDSLSLRRAIEHLLEHPEYAATLASDARVSACESFSLERFVTLVAAHLRTSRAVSVGAPVLRNSR